MAAIAMTDDQIVKLVDDAYEAALNAACKHIQTELGQTDGGFASIFWASRQNINHQFLRIYANGEEQIAMEEDRKPRRKVKMVCTACGTDGVTCDAVCRWCVETQEWEVSGLFDNTDCDECGGECRVKEVET